MLFHGINFWPIYGHELRITSLLIIWILSGYINLGTSITATFTYCFCHHCTNGVMSKYLFFMKVVVKLGFIIIFYYCDLYMSNIIIIIIIMVLFFLPLILSLLFTLLLLLWILFMPTLMWVEIMLYRLTYYSDLLLCDF